MDSREQDTKATGESHHGEPTIVQGKGFRCLAYRDHKGKWRGFVGHEELGDVTPIDELKPLQ